MTSNWFPKRKRGKAALEVTDKLSDCIRMVPDFITPDEEEFLMKQMPVPRPRANKPEGRILRNRRHNDVKFVPRKIFDKLREAGFTGRPFCYVNEYLGGDGLEMHTDSRCPANNQTFIINVGADVEMAWGKGVAYAPDTRLSPWVDGPGVFTLPFPRRAMVHFWGEAFFGWVHGIKPVPSLRYSFVFWARCPGDDHGNEVHNRPFLKDWVKRGL